MLLRSGLCPPALKSPEAVLFVILAGRDLGLSPVAALRGVTIIQGKIEVSADLQLGLFHRAGGRSSFEVLTEDEASLTLVAPWLTSPHTSRFSMGDAKRAGLVNATWQKFPKAMLRSRAITQGLKDIGFDATAGCYAPGEIGGPERVEDVGAPALSPGEEVRLALPSGEPEESPASLAEALGAPIRLPGHEKAFGGWGGKPMTECPPKALLAFLAWCDEAEGRSATYGDAIVEALRLTEGHEEVAA